MVGRRVRWRGLHSTDCGTIVEDSGGVWVVEYGPWRARFEIRAWSDRLTVVR